MQPGQRLGRLHLQPVRVAFPSAYETRARRLLGWRNRSEWLRASLADLRPKVAGLLSYGSVRSSESRREVERAEPLPDPYICSCPRTGLETAIWPALFWRQTLH